MAEWSDYALFFAGGSWGAGSNPGFFFLSSFFYSLAFYCLFSQLTLLASRDFCENLFLVYELDLFKLNTLCNRDVNTTENLY